MDTYCNVSVVKSQKHQHQILESGWITQQINTTNKLQEMDTLNKIHYSSIQYL
jgi:hypothetical protein